MRRVASIAVRSGILALAPTRYNVERRGPTGDPSLFELFEDVLNLRRVEMAVSFGPPRPNRKPVFMVMDHAGTPIAFAKLGWNEQTKPLVLAEAETLVKQELRDLRQVTAPRLVQLAEWSGHPLAIYEATIGVPGRMQPDPEMFHEVSAAWPVSRTLLGEGHLAEAALSWAERRAGVGHEVDHRAVMRALDRYGHLEIEEAGWHGDWTPWNTARRGDGGAVVWDWERAGPGVPFGFDQIHFWFQPRASGGAQVLFDRPAELSTKVGASKFDALAVWYLIALSMRHEGRYGLSYVEDLDRRLA